MSEEIYKGEAKKLDDIDISRIGSEIKVGEDPIHALIEVETRGTGFDSQERIIILFEPHKFYRHLRGEKRDEAVREGLAYPTWGERPYPRDSYPLLIKALAIDETAALLSCSWGMGQIMGENFGMLGYESVQDMVTAFAESEANQLEGMIEFIKSAGIDDDLRRIQKIIDSGRTPTPQDWVSVVRVYNGSGYSKNQYHIRAAKSLAKWMKIKDTPFGKGIEIAGLAAGESQAAETGNLDEWHAKQVQMAEISTEQSESTEKAAPTTGDPSKKDEQSGTLPPQPAEEIKASAPSLFTKLGSLALPSGVMAVLAAVGRFFMSLPPWAFVAIVIVALVVGYLIWRDSQQRHHQLTLKVMDAAADKNSNNLRII